MFQLDPVLLYDGGFGAWMVPIAPPDAQINPDLGLSVKERGKVPATLTGNGWALYKGWPNSECPDLRTAQLWRDNWHANIGLRGGPILGIDNDIGKIVTDVLTNIFSAEHINPLRRFVADPKHERDLFILRIIDDIVGAPVELRGHDLAFNCGLRRGVIQLLGKGKQFVASGIHPGTKAPYVLNRKIEKYEDIPEITESVLDRILKALIERLDAQNWKLAGGPQTVSKTRQNPTPAAVYDIHQQATADKLLKILVNREVPTDQQTDIDRHFDFYANYIQIAYALFAVFGAAGRDRWLIWACGRTQPGQKPEAVWESVIHNPKVEAGLYTLEQLVQKFEPQALAHLRFADIPEEPEEQAPAPAVAARTPVWDRIRNEWGFIATKNLYVNLKTGDLIKKEALDTKLRLEAVRIEYEIFPAHKGQPWPMSKILSLRDDSFTFWNMTYAPGEPMKVPVSGAPGEFDFNHWQPPAPLKTENIAESAVTPWLDHVEYVVGKDHKDLFIEWCAWVVQNPGRKPNWHFLIITIQGVGKDMMVLPLQLAVGPRNYIAAPIFSIADSFNDVFEHKLLVISETRHVNTRNMSAHDTSTKLKALLASPPTMHTINAKFQQRYQIPNRQAVILFSNESNPLYLEQDQRRIVTINRRHVPLKSANYYQGFKCWLDNDGSAMVAAYLSQMKLAANADLRMESRAIATADTAELENINRNPLHVAIDELIEEARLGQGSFTSLIATPAEIVSHVSRNMPWKVSPQAVGSYLRELEQRDKGVLRAKPEAGGVAGTISVKGEGGRFWFLSDKTPEGRDWDKLTYAELIARWKNQPPPASATVTPLRKQFPPSEI